jgi:SAM-dependent methyltransferase
MTDQFIQIHDSVQKHYAAAIQNDVSCCGDGADCCSPQYDVSLLAALPDDITGLSMGCGDPVTIASLNAGETALDLGSGAGMDCFLAARQVGEAGHVIGVDMTPAMLDKANANKTRLGAENVEFRKGHIEALPVEDNTVDVVMSNCVINLSPDKAAVFQEAFRVLKPGGRLAVSDIVTEGSFNESQRADAAQWAACVTGAIDAADYVAHITAAGFVDVAVVDKSDSDLDGMVADGPRVYSARVTARKPTA